MEQEYTTEESDALILQEMGLAEDDSITNDNEEVESEEVETQEEDSNEEVETYEETTETDEEQEQVKPKRGIAKVLHQRNEARKEAEQAKSQVQELQAKLDELEAEGNYGNEEYIQTLVDKRMAEAEEKTEFFENNEELKSFKKDILSYAKETGLTLDKASKLYLAENKPELLLEPETRNKQKSKIYGTPSQTSKNLKEGKFTYSDDEFEEMARKGLIKF